MCMQYEYSLKLIMQVCTYWLDSDYKTSVTTVIGHVHMYRCNSDEVFEYVGVNDSPIAYSYIQQKT